MKSSVGTILRNRKGASAAGGNTPNRAPSARLFYQDSPVPGAKKTWKMDNPSGNESEGSRDSSDGCASLPISPVETTEKAMSGEQVQKAESKTKKILVRVVFGAFMFSIFAGSVRNKDNKGCFNDVMNLVLSKSS